MKHPFQRRAKQAGPVRRSLGEGGFTLVELMVAIGLMVILVGSMVMIFASSTFTVKVSEARLRVLMAARTALDQVERDVSSMLPMDRGMQRFWMTDCAFDVNGGFYTTSDDKRNYNYGGDAIGFNTVTSVKGVMVPAMVVYRLVCDPGGDRQKTVDRVVNGVLTPGRQLYILRKELRNISGGALMDPTIPGGGTPLDTQSLDLCYYVLSFNVEYLSDQGKYSQIAPGPAGMPNGPFPGPTYTFFNPKTLTQVTAAPADPMGQPTGGNDLNDEVLPSGRQAPKFIIPALRATLRIVEDVEARQERVFTREMWLPTG